jgi:hypothetical protein
MPRLRLCRRGCVLFVFFLRYSVRVASLSAAVLLLFEHVFLLFEHV